MNHLVIGVIQVVLDWGCSDVPVFVPVTLQNSIRCCEENITTDIKFAVMNPIISNLLQEALFYVFLDDHTAIAFVGLGQPGQNFRQYFLFGFDHLDPTASIAIFTRLTYPNILTLFLNKRVGTFYNFSLSNFCMSYWTVGEFRSSI